MSSFVMFDQAVLVRSQNATNRDAVEFAAKLKLANNGLAAENETLRARNWELGGIVRQLAEANASLQAADIRLKASSDSVVRESRKLLASHRMLREVVERCDGWTSPSPWRYIPLTGGLEPCGANCVTLTPATMPVSQ